MTFVLNKDFTLFRYGKVNFFRFMFFFHKIFHRSIQGNFHVIVRKSLISYVSFHSVLCKDIQVRESIVETRLYICIVYFLFTSSEYVTSLWVFGLFVGTHDVYCSFGWSSTWLRSRNHGPRLSSLPPRVFRHSRFSPSLPPSPFSPKPRGFGRPFDLLRRTL